MLRSGHYAVLLTDPPWDYNEVMAGGQRSTMGTGAANGLTGGYNIMTLQQLKDMSELGALRHDAACFIWCSGRTIFMARELMEAWGFVYKSVAFTWAKCTKHGKLHFGPGYWTRAGSEFVIMGMRGRVERKARNVRQLVWAPVMKHSMKPDFVNTEIQRLMDGPYLELFARRKLKGWRTWGNEL